MHHDHQQRSEIVAFLAEQFPLPETHKKLLLGCAHQHVPLQKNATCQTLNLAALVGY